MLGLKKYFVKYKNRESVEAEEIFLDAEAVRSIEEKGKLEQPIKSSNFIIFFVFILICLSFLLFRAGYLQVIKGDYYQDLAQGNRLKIYPISAPRGIIYDKELKPLVYNIPSFDLVVNLSDFFDNSEEIQKEILEKINVILSQQTKDLKDKDSSVIPQNDKEIKKSLYKILKDAQGEVSQVVLLRGIERSSALIFETLVNEWPGLRLEKNAQREYVSGSYFSHILGYTGQVNKSDLDNNPDYWLNDQIGKNGLEYFYEDILRGQSGQEQIEVDSLGKIQRLLAGKSAQPGLSMVLHIDKELQIKIFDILKEKGERAVALAINPNNGGVLAMVSLPSFDNNMFAQGISKEDLINLESDSSKPFLNRALSGQYPSGSIIKPFIAAAALEENIIEPYQQINCTGVINIYNMYNSEIVYRFPDWKTHGLTDVIHAIAESCNIFFYTVGGGYGDIEGLGADRIKQYLEYFGLGQKTKIDLPHEEEGLIPNEEQYLGDVYHLSIGQGDMLVTPLQMVTALVSIANNGTLYQPQIIDKIINTDGNLVKDVLSQINRQNFIDPMNIEIVQKGMREAVISGSAISLSSLSVEVAGKTGTAQFGNKGETHSWFIGYAPYENPQIAIIVLVEGGGEGYEVAVPVAKQILEYYFSK